MEVSGTKLFADLLEEKARLHPDKPWLVFEDTRGQVSTLSYGAFAAQVDRLCNALLRAGVAPGQKVALMMPNCPEFLVAWLAINQAGAVMVPVNVFYAPDELMYLLQNSESVGFIAAEQFIAGFEHVMDRCPDVRVRICARTEQAPVGFRSLADILLEESDVHQVVRVAPTAPAQIVFTSGTTSRPKGAVISHASSLIQGIAISQALAMTPEDRTCVVLPLFHVNGQYVGVVPTLTVGGTLVLLESYSATRFWEQVRAHDCSLTSIVPMQLRTMLAQPPHPDDARHRVRFSFYALPTTDDEWDRFEQRFGVRLVEGYGLSETLGICTCNPVFGRSKRHCIGLPVLGRQVRVVDEQGADVATGQVGRILVRGEAMFSGYYANPAATEACMREGWFDTGDTGSFDDEGYLFFFDRSKDVIKRAGENIAATEVERVLNEHPAIEESAVIAVPDALRDEAVKAFVVVRAGQSLTADEVRDWCLQHLARFKVPSFVEFIPALPKTSIGKISKHVLKEAERAARQQQPA
jgi:crotonobetaine/carnitine-CoA ligase